MMQAFNRKERIRLHAFILGSSALLFVLYALALPDFRYFWDPSVKWFQILDLIRNDFRDISCVYPARPFDPEFRHMPVAYVSVIDGECRYWFPFQLSYVFAPLHMLLGVWSIPVLQHAFSIFILYAMAIVCARLGLSFGGTLTALVLFRLGTANLNSVANLEDHVIAAALFMAALVLLLREKSEADGKLNLPVPFGAGLLAGCAFAFRPEAALTGPFLLAAILMTAGSRKRRVAQAFAFGSAFACALVVLLFMNEAMTGHALGLRSMDPVNRVPYTDFAGRLKRAAAHFFLAPEWWLNGLLFQMPLLFAAVLNLRAKHRAGAGTTRSLLIASCVLFPLLYIAPFGGPHIGFRFGTFLYPVLIPLALRPFRGSGTGARVLVAVLCAYSIMLTVPAAVFGVGVYRGYLKTHNELKAAGADAVLLRDDIMWHALSDHYYERPVMRALKHEDVEKLTARLRKAGLRRILLARSAARPARDELVPPAYGGRVKRSGKTAVMEWAVLEWPAGKTR